MVAWKEEEEEEHDDYCHPGRCDFVETEGTMRMEGWKKEIALSMMSWYY